LLSLGAILAGLLPLPGAARADAIAVTITSPSPGSTVLGIVTIRAETAGPVLSVAFDVTTDAGVTWVPISTDTSTSDGWAASWDPGDHEGDATLRALATGDGSTATAIVTIRVGGTLPPVTIGVSRRAFSPNGDGRADRTVLEVHLGVSATLTVQVLTSDEDVVHTLVEEEPNAPGDLAVPWEGEGERATLPDGRYRIRALAVDELGAAHVARTAVVLDTQAPRLRGLVIRPDPYRGTGSVRISFRAPDRSPRLTVGALISDAWGRRVAQLPPRPRRTGTLHVRWDGLDAQGRPVTPGLRTIAVRVRDDAGNLGVSEAVPFRDHRPVTSRLIHRVDGARDRVALTFDDCYDASAWQRILSVLEDRGAGGSFFCLGPDVLASSALARRTVADGFTVGSHGWDHASAPSLSASQLRDRVRREADAWWRVARTTPVPYYRPSYGEVDAEALAAVGQEGFAFTVLWDVDPWDWSRPGSSAIASRVLAHVRSGSVVALHAIEQTAAALPAIIDGLRARGLEPVTVADLLRGPR
jgi:peptidoglycan/xylan/chitin deacetylase (PgdA/CDA1 family)